MSFSSQGTSTNRTTPGASPDNAQPLDERTRRPRVVNSCDNCRRKKARCVRQPDQETCDVCKAAKVECTYADRQRYQLERERRYAPLLANSAAGKTSCSNAGMSTPNVAAPASTTSQAPAPLFDPLQMSQPHPALLPGLITAYFQCLHHTTPIISHESVISQYLLSALPAVLANTLAGLAAPYSSFTPELRGVDLGGAAQTYLDHAKRILQTETQPVSVSAVQACVLIARAEMQAGRLIDFRAYAQRAVYLAGQLQLGDDHALARLSSTTEEHACLLSLRAHVMELYRLISQA